MWIIKKQSCGATPVWCVRKDFNVKDMYMYSEAALRSSSLTRVGVDRRRVST
jgi:hypothetical protein